MIGTSTELAPYQKYIFWCICVGSFKRLNILRVNLSSKTKQSLFWKFSMYKFY